MQRVGVLTPANIDEPPIRVYPSTLTFTGTFIPLKQPEGVSMSNKNHVHDIDFNHKTMELQNLKKKNQCLGVG